MRRIAFVMMIGLLLVWGEQAMAGLISITGTTRLDVSLRDADRVEALTALFATAGGARTLLLSDGVAGRIDRLQLAGVSFDAALAGILGPDYRYEAEMQHGAVAYHISNPAIVPAVVAPPEPAPAQAAPRAAMPFDPFSITLTITSPSSGGSLNLGGGSLTRASRQPQSAPRQYGIHYTETFPFILIDESFDPFGRIIRTPQVYYQTFGAGFDINGSRIHPYLDTPTGGLTIPSNLGAGTIFGGSSVTIRP